MTVGIRAEAPGEAPAIRAVDDRAFGTTHEGRIVDDIRGTDRWIDGGSIVAVDEEADDPTTGSLVGHLLISEGDVDLDGGGTRRIWMIGPVAVIPERQGQGIGGMLVRAAAALGTERGQPLLILLGHADYYPRFGFEPARAIGIEAPRPWRDANWLALRLPAWTPDLRGVARFPAAFPDAQ
jgi:putative acetyltransferase